MSNHFVFEAITLTVLTFIVNFKNYEESIGDDTEILIQKLNEARNGNKVFFSLPLTHLLLGKKYHNLLSQHVDFHQHGPFTGRVVMEDLKKIGISGSLLNHSEYKVDHSVIRKTIKRADVSEFELFICARDLDEAKTLCEMGARTIAYEPEELIGGNISVSSSKPEIIEKCFTICEEYGANLFIGAGIKNRDDVKRGKELGAKGILISSGIVKSKEPKNSLNSLMI